MTLTSSEDGVIHFSKNEGATFGAGEVLGEFDLDDPSLCQRAVPSTMIFPATVGAPRAPLTRSHKVLGQYIQTLSNLVRGFSPSKGQLDTKLRSLIPEFT